MAVLDQRLKLPLRIEGLKTISNVAKKRVVEQNKARELADMESISVTLRYCLECNSPFESVGNRRCADCRAKEDE